MITTKTVRRYYEQNTRMMLRFGSSPRVQTIHRALWPSEVHTLDDALHYAHQLLLTEIKQLTHHTNQATLRIADLGCGIGTSLRYLLTHLQLPTTAVGITISSTQAQMAQAHVGAQHTPAKHTCAVLEADFLHVPLCGGFDAVYSIEAFSHSPSAERYFAQAARLLRPGGRLILIDDFLAPTTSPTHEWVTAYQAGWFVPNVQPVSTIAALAEAVGLRLASQRNLTPLLHLRALPNWLALRLLQIGQRWPSQHAMVPSMLGSMALQQCLRDELTQYRLLVFERYG